MAKSIYEILNDLNTTTSVPGYGSEIEHTIPRELLPTAEEFESEEELVNWATETGYMHACLQKGVQKFLIEIRAAFKSCKKDDEWSEDYGQANVDKMEWKITNRPNVGGSKAISKAVMDKGIQMAQAMQMANIPDEAILSSLVAAYGDNDAKAILESLTE